MDQVEYEFHFLTKTGGGKRVNFLQRTENKTNLSDAILSHNGVSSKQSARSYDQLARLTRH